MGCGHNPADFYVHRCDDGTQAPQTGVHALIIGTSEYRYEHKRTTAYDKLDDIHSFTRVFLKAEEDRPNPFYYSLNVKLVEEALEYNYSQTKIIISDCCHTFVDAKHENGILIDVDDGRKTEFAHIHRKYDPLHITSGRDGADTYALGASEGTVLSYVLEQLLGSAGRIVRHPARYKERYFAITQDVMTERVSPIFQRHRKATYMPDSIPVVHGQTVDGGLHRPAPPPKFHVEFVVMDAAETDPVDVTITNSDGCEVGPECIPVQVRDPLDPQLAGYDLAATLRPGK